VSRDYPFREIRNRGFGSPVDNRSGSRLDKSRRKRGCGHMGRGHIDQCLTQGANLRLRFVQHFGVSAFGIPKGHVSPCSQTPKSRLINLEMLACGQALMNGQDPLGGSWVWDDRPM
jgi:hypothetical protein